MEYMAGRVAGDHQLEVMGGVIDQSIAVATVKVMRRRVALFLE